MAALTISLAFMLLYFFTLLGFSSQEELEFTFNGFNETLNNPSLIPEGASIIEPSGALRLTNSSNDVIGHAFYPRPIPMFAKNSSASPAVSTFSTSFAFVIVTPTRREGVYGLAFTFAPSTKFPGAQPGQFLGIFNSTSDGSSSNHVFAVEFDTVDGHNGKVDSEGNHVGVNINTLRSERVEPAAYYDNVTKEDIFLERGEPFQAWIEYDGEKKLVNVTICPLGIKKPVSPLLSHSIDLKSVFKEAMYVGFSASTGKKASSHFILGWSFAMIRTAPSLNISRLPLPHQWKRSLQFS